MRPGSGGGRYGMRSIERVVGCSINTVDKLLRDAGEAALDYHDEHVRGVKANRPVR